MKVKYGKGKTEYGPGVEIKLTGSEVAVAIYTYLAAHRVHIRGAATISVNGELCKKGSIYVDPSGFVVANGKGFSGRGEDVKIRDSVKVERDLINTLQDILNLSFEDLENGNYDDIKFLKDNAKRLLEDEK